MTLQTSAASPAVVAAIEVLDRLQTVRNVLAPDLNDQELQLFALVAQRSGLDPFAKQIYAVKRQGRVTFQTGIDGYRSTAERTGEYDGSDEPEFGEMMNGHPESATVTVYRWRNGRRVGQTATAYWAEFYPGDGQGHMWKKMPRNQLAKCAEALAMRKAFPYVLADIYTPEEMDQAGPGDNAALVEAAKQPTAAERIAARRQAVEATATEPTREEVIAHMTNEQVGMVVTGREPDADVVEGEAVAVSNEPAVGGCGWALETKNDIVACSLAEMHEGSHSWQDQAVKSGGKVLRPAE